ncbi:hypothetical protein DPEC_G00216400 [Dallia pectoralis]|uniref:Uncharacterized protein n=1 Tax=Dallia pectoralis TaxID=75939 RepID=A0ACC2G2R7_DALPE|nr:hypothetical protein DPEC_G00216400 [Dallia pectoralis]
MAPSTLKRWFALVTILWTKRKKKPPPNHRGTLLTCKPVFVENSSYRIYIVSRCWSCDGGVSRAFIVTIVHHHRLPAQCVCVPHFTMTLHHLVLSPTLGLLALCCLSSGVNGIHNSPVPRQPITKEIDCSKACSLRQNHSTQCRQAVFSKENSTCLLLMCFNGSECNNISAVDLPTGRVSGLKARRAADGPGQKETRFNLTTSSTAATQPGTTQSSNAINNKSKNNLCHRCDHLRCFHVHECKEAGANQSGGPHVPSYLGKGFFTYYHHQNNFTNFFTYDHHQNSFTNFFTYDHHQNSFTNFFTYDHHQNSFTNFFTYDHHQNSFTNFFTYDHHQNSFTNFFTYDHHQNYFTNFFTYDHHQNSFTNFFTYDHLKSSTVRPRGRHQNGEHEHQ